MSFGTMSPPEPLEEQGAGIFSRIKHSLKEAICTHEQTKTTSIYSQENVPLVVQAKPPGWLISATSSYCGSPFLPSLELGSTLATSLQSDNEGNKERSEHTNIENLKPPKKRWRGKEMKTVDGSYQSEPTPDHVLRDVLG